MAGAGAPRPSRSVSAGARASTTPSSSGRSIVRSWSRKASATPASWRRASALSVASGSPWRLPLVTTSRSSGAVTTPSPKSQRCSGELGGMTPRAATSGATPSGAGSGRSAIGPSGSPVAPRCITARACRGRRFRARSRATAAALVASTTSWKPPTPLTAITSPRRRRWCSAAMIARGAASASARPPGSTSRGRGPQVGQQKVWAWKRRLAGSPYSARQSAQSGKSAIAVRARSKGRPRRIEARGPQRTQATNGSRWRRPPGSKYSARQSAQGRRSAGTGSGPAASFLASSAAALFATTKVAAPVGAAASTSTASILAGGRSAWRSAGRKASSTAAGPSSSTSTARPRLRTAPTRPRAFATRAAVGRKPTPCTTPVKRRRRAGRGRDVTPSILA